MKLVPGVNRIYKDLSKQLGNRVIANRSDQLFPIPRANSSSLLAIRPPLNVVDNFKAR